MGTVGRLLAAAITLAITAAASAQFYSVGRPPEALFTSVNGLSSDGSVAVGVVGTSTYQYAFTWTPEAGRNDYGYEGQFPTPPSGLGISGDGRVAVGRVNMQQGNQFLARAYRWTGLGTFESLGDTGRFTNSEAVDANRDGSAIVGNITNDRGTGVRPFRWTTSGGLQSLGFAGGDDTRAYAISDDGNTIVGNVSAAGRGFVWTADGGYRLMTGLPGSLNGNAAIYAMNRAGTIYAGNSLLPDIGTTGALWKDGTIIDMGNLEGTRGFYPSSIDDAGRIVAGFSSMLGPSIATVWTAERGIESLEFYLASQGVFLPRHVRLSTCSSMSSDGLTFGGTAYYAGDSAASFGYVVTIPAPSSLVAAAGLLILSSPRRRRL